MVRWLCSWVVVVLLVVLIHSCLGLCSRFIHARAGQGASSVWGADWAGGEALHTVGAGARMVYVMGKGAWSIMFNPHPLHSHMSMRGRSMWLFHWMNYCSMWTSTSQGTSTCRIWALENSHKTIQVSPLLLSTISLRKVTKESLIWLMNMSGD